MKAETEISPKVRRIVYNRDSWDDCPCCIICGKPVVEIHHYIERSRGGRGIPENLVCLCPEHHYLAHQEDKETKEFIVKYLKSFYKGWNEQYLKVDKWRTYGSFKSWDDSQGN